MRVLLINPFYPISETPSPPLGLAYLAAALEEAGVEVRVLDLVVTPYSAEMLAQSLDNVQPDMVGLTAVTMTVDHAMAVIDGVKRHRPRTVTVMGGPHVTFSAPQTLKACPSLDVAVLGEGEQTLVELVRAVAAGSGFENVAGIAHRTNGAIRCTPPRAFIADLDSLPLPARHRLPLGRYRALGMPISMTTTRGCPHQCIFCVGRKMVGAKVRYRSPRKVVDELEAIGRLGFHQVNIVDDLFTADKGHCAAVCDEILRRALKVQWTSFARVDTVSEDILAKMKAAGCTAVSFGVESANRAILKTIKKRITPEQVVEAVRMCTRTGVTPFASFILGLPGETPETIQETMEFGRKLGELGLLYGFHLLAPFPGTDVRKRSNTYGIRILTDDWTQYHANRAVTETETVSRGRLDAIAVEWEDNFNRYLGGIKERMQAGTAGADEAKQLINLERIVAIYDLMMKQAIETAGCWKADGDSANRTLERLIGQASGMVESGPAVIRKAIEDAVQKENLVCNVQDGRVEWRWKDYI
jgi:anaerobic magnesium-protoporphyrin IX monomethyl ester cyclase